MGRPIARKPYQTTMVKAVRGMIPGESFNPIEYWDQCFDLAASNPFAGNAIGGTGARPLQRRISGPGVIELAWQMSA